MDIIETMQLSAINRLKQKMKEWITSKGPDVQIPRVFDDRSGLSSISTIGCGCCAWDLSLSDDEEDALKDFTYDDQREIVMHTLAGYMKERNISIRQLVDHFGKFTEDK